MTHKFSPGEYTMRNGRKAVILSDQYPCGDYQLVGIYETEWGDWHLGAWTTEGQFNASGNQSDFDLMPPLVERYVCVDKTHGYASKALLDGKKYSILKLFFDGDKLVASEVVSE